MYPPEDVLIPFPNSVKKNIQRLVSDMLRMERDKVAER